MPRKTQNQKSQKPSTHETRLGLPADVAAIRNALQAFLKSPDANSKRIGGSKCGIYAFYDYDGEPIYVGQTYEGLGARIGRHLTNQRTDAVAMNVLDPFEVAEVRVWPLDLDGLSKEEQIEFLDKAEFTVFQKLLSESKLGAILNEKPPHETETVQLPKDYRKRIIPDDIFPHRKHPDVRIARRASTIANLARVISERKVSQGLRQTLLTQAKRLEKLSAQRLEDFPVGSEDDGEEN
jgi:GIY-YIG catalytic domain